MSAPQDATLATADDLSKPPETLTLSAEDTSALEAESARAADEAGDDTDGALANGKAGAGEEGNSEGNKLKVLIGLLKRVVGVKDLAAIRFSLPATLLEPVPNLEYWTYLDRADLWAAVPEFEDPLDRMLAVIRFAITMQLKFVRGKVCKPYNSILGEHFRCHWQVDTPQVTQDGSLLPVQDLVTEAASPYPMPGVARKAAAATGGSRPGSVKSGRGGAGDEEASASSATQTARRGLSRFLSGGGGAGGSALGRTSSSSTSTSKSAADTDDAKSGTTAATSLTPATAAGSVARPSQKRRVAFLTEQVSHHPPISTFFCECREAGVFMRGVDQLSAKFTGASVKVYPGDQNKGLFIGLTDRARAGAAVDGEEYQITHPTASINGFFRGSIWVAIADAMYITCRGGRREGEQDGKPGKRLRTIIEFKDESWLTKAKYALEGAIYEYDASEEDEEEYTKIKQVPQERIVATFEGQWRGDVHYKLKGDKEPRLLVRLDDLGVTKKTVRPMSAHEDMESRKIWAPVTDAIIGKEFSAATKHKQEIEQMQRDAAAERKRKGEEFVPQFFNPDFIDGRPKLTEAGKKALVDEDNLVGYSENA